MRPERQSAHTMITQTLRLARPLTRLLRLPQHPLDLFGTLAGGCERRGAPPHLRGRHRLTFFQGP